MLDMYIRARMELPKSFNVKRLHTIFIKNHTIYMHIYMVHVEKINCYNGVHLGVGFNSGQN